jgi:hypothetical protein
MIEIPLHNNDSVTLNFKALQAITTIVELHSYKYDNNPTGDNNIDMAFQANVSMQIDANSTESGCLKYKNLDNCHLDIHCINFKLIGVHGRYNAGIDNTTYERACAENFVRVTAYNPSLTYNDAIENIALVTGQDDYYIVNCMNCRIGIKPVSSGNIVKYVHHWNNSNDWAFNSKVVYVPSINASGQETIIRMTIENFVQDGVYIGVYKQKQINLDNTQFAITIQSGNVYGQPKQYLYGADSGIVFYVASIDQINCIDVFNQSLAFVPGTNCLDWCIDGIRDNGTTDKKIYSAVDTIVNHFIITATFSNLDNCVSSMPCCVPECSYALLDNVRKGQSVKQTLRYSDNVMLTREFTVNASPHVWKTWSLSTFNPSTNS